MKKKAPIRDSVFWDSNLTGNGHFLALMAGLMLVLEGVMLVLYFANERLGLPVIPRYYLPVYLVAVAAALVYLLAALKLRGKNSRQWLQWGFLTFLLTWSAVFSALDVVTGRSAYLFAIIMIFCCVGARMKTWYHIGLNAAAFGVYLGMLLSAPIDQTTKLGELLNVLLTMVMACAVLIHLNRRWYEDYQNRLTIKAQNDKLTYYATHDYLTDIPNKMEIRRCLKQWLGQDGKRMACLMVDIDDFKIYNDAMGHVEGDQCLVAVSHVLKEQAARVGGLAGRYGGEEFMLLLPDVTQEQVPGLAAEIIGAVRQKQLTYPKEGGRAAITVSVGGCLAERESGVQTDEVVRAADCGLYQAKRTGKDRFEWGMLPSSQKREENSPL